QVLHPARDVQGPHVVAEVPLDLAGDGGHGVALEGVAECGVVPVDGLDEAESGDLAQVVVALAAAAETAGETVGHGEPRLDDLVAERVTLRARREVRQPAAGGGRVGGVVMGVGLGARSHRDGASQLPTSARGRTVTVRHAPVFGTGTRGGDATSRTCLLSEALFCPCPPPPLANPSRRVTLRDRTACGRRGGRPTARAVRGGPSGSQGAVAASG